MNSTLQPDTADPHVPTRDEVPAPREPQLLGTSAICQRLGIHRNTWHVWVVSRQAPAPVPNLPGHPRWRVSDIERFERGRFRRG
jgi:hypothetical protein